MKLRGEKQGPSKSVFEPVPFPLRYQEHGKSHLGPSRPDQLQLNTTEQSQITPGGTEESPGQPAECLTPK